MPLPALIPRAVLFGSSARLSPALSPSGRRLAYLAPCDGALNIWVGTPGARDHRPVTCDPRGVLAFRWMYDDRHLVYPQDHGGDERTRLIAVNIATGRFRDLTPEGAIRGHVVGCEPAAPGQLLVESCHAEDGRYDVCRITARTGERQLVASESGVVSWLADRELRLRGVLMRAADGAMTIRVRDTERAAWRTVYEVDPDDAASLRVISFTADGQALFAASSKDAPATRLLRIGLAGGPVELVYQDPDGYDVTELSLDPHTREPRLAFVLRGRREAEVLDPAVADDVRHLRRHCSGDLSLMGTDRADRRWLIGESRDDHPVAYHLYLRRTGRIMPLFSHLPAIEPFLLARTEPFSFTARDGMAVHGYLTFPPTRKRRRLPAVLAVHGGPWFRTGWGFRALPQWLANRGYLCVEVNFRGSAGYGKRFRNAGDREWGGRMQDDLTDAILTLITSGVAAADRIAIYGSSYGGYAALAGAAFTPDLFRCAIAVAGPSDLRTFVAASGDPPHPVAVEMRRRVGDPVADAEFLWSRSPLARADRIRIPLLIAQGANDPKVKPRESAQIVAAVRANGVPCEYLLFEDEGHGFVRQANRMTFYAAAERFLAAHLGGLSEPAENEAARR